MSQGHFGLNRGLFIFSSRAAASMSLPIKCKALSTQRFSIRPKHGHGIRTAGRATCPWGTSRAAGRRRSWRSSGLVAERRPDDHPRLAAAENNQVRPAEDDVAVVVDEQDVEYAVVDLDVLVRPVRKRLHLIGAVHLRRVLGTLAVVIPDVLVDVLATALERADRRDPDLVEFLGERWRERVRL